MSSPPSQLSITPASLFSLAIFNPALGPTDETVGNQIVFFTSREPQTPNERLRQVGLAQGVVEFAKGFNGSENLSQMETERSRIVLQEVEEGWWILAHVDFTRISSGQPDNIEYSSREVSHPRLLLAQLTSAYNQYRFLYGMFDTNIKELGRERFCRRLEKYWVRWVRRWEVVPTGNPAVEVWGGIKMAQPRLGAAVREVLEAFVMQERAVEGGGLVDMVVSRFGKIVGHEEGGNESSATPAQPEPSRVSSALTFSLWPASTNSSPVPSRTHSPGRPPSLLPLSFTPEPEPTAVREVTVLDGCIFSGTGHLDPTAVRDISTWVSNVYLWSEDRIVPPSTRSRKGKRPRLSRLSSTPNHGSGEERCPLGVSEKDSIDSSIGLENGSAGTHLPGKSRPRSLIPAQRQSMDGIARGTSAASHTRGATVASQAGTTTLASTAANNSTTSNGKLLNILTFGWAGGEGGSAGIEASGRGRYQGAQNPITTETNAAESYSQPGSPKFRPDTKKNGQPRFLYGYTGDLEDDEDEIEGGGLNNDGVDNPSSRVHRGKITERPVWLLDSKSDIPSGKQSRIVGSDDEQVELQRSSTDRTLRSLTFKEFRVVVYLNPPFTFTLIFEPKTPRLSSPSFYRSLHLRLGPLRNSLLPSMPRSTRPGSATPAKPVVYELLFDPVTLATSSSLPNIPSYPSYGDVHAPPQPWSRVDAIHIHNHIVNIYADSERGQERKSRTTRGWWLAYNRLGSSRKEAILVWKGGERGKGGNDRLSGQVSLGGDIEGGAIGLGGILDTRRYFEGLLRGKR
ncbi:hypothetical protein EV426DRAFT_699429 [Tirmania nivea]|nr:hypothetical protein EV426DRAFT_699429 [Tirmania nivea]